MCRLFGLLGNSVTPADPWLLFTDRSLLRQSNVSPETAQKDGWGIAWFDASRNVRLEKGAAGAYRPGEVERFTQAARESRGPLVLGHLRHASNPMDLPPERLLGLENSQPFVHGSTLFAHNGSIPFPRETRTKLGRFEPRVKGVNDSEVLFWLLVRHIEETGDPLRAYAETVQDLEEVWNAQGAPPPGPYSGLNVLISRGPNELWAFCRYLGEHGTGLLDTTRPYYEMTYAADAKQLVVGSEPFDTKRRDWVSLPNGHYLFAQATHGLVALQTGELPAAKPAPVPVSRTGSVPTA